MRGMRYNGVMDSDAMSSHMEEHATQIIHATANVVFDDGQAFSDAYEMTEALPHVKLVVNKPQKLTFPRKFKNRRTQPIWKGNY